MISHHSDDKSIDLSSERWDVVDKVFSNLLATYQGSALSEWWSHLMGFENVHACGMYVPGKYRYRGWFTEFSEGKKVPCKSKICRVAW